DRAILDHRRDRPAAMKKRVNRRLGNDSTDAFEAFFAAAHSGQPIVDHRNPATAVITHATIASVQPEQSKDYTRNLLRRKVGLAVVAAREDARDWGRRRGLFPSFGR